ncbi:MAG: FAD-dependent oxidoreductase [Candidatus Woesearchaeota archaeon]
MKKIYETIIIGGGIAGCTAAVYAARKKMDFLLITENVGGQMWESVEIFNFPGINKISGADFSQRIQEQLDFNQIKIKSGVQVNKIVKKGKLFLLRTDSGDFFSKTMIIATGSHPRTLDVPGEKEFRNMGVTYCAICDGPLFKGKDVAIIGGGNSALEAVDFLSKVAKKIYVLNVNPNFNNVHASLLEKAVKSKNVKIIYNALTIKINGDRFVKSLEYTQKGKFHTLSVQGVFVEIGRIPAVDLVKGLLKLDEHNHILVDCQTNTSVPGIFAVGDCSSVHEYQYVIAAGQGCIALLKAAKYLARQK